LDTRARILCVGYDEILLQSRKDMLSNFFKAETVLGLKRLPAICSFDLIVLCHTLTAEECRYVCDLVRGQSPRPQILALKQAMSPPLGELVDKEFFVGEGPYKLLKTVEKMLAGMARGVGGSGKAFGSRSQTNWPAIDFGRRPYWTGSRRSSPC
jgi:hypothetical protein